MFEKLANSVQKNHSMLFHWLIMWFIIILNLGISFIIRESGLTIVQNSNPIGFAFGYFSSILLLAFISWYLVVSKTLKNFPIYSILILAGVWSNFIEKVVFDAVADYINIGISNLNLADVQIVVGVVLLNIQFWFLNGVKNIPVNSSFNSSISEVKIADNVEVEKQANDFVDDSSITEVVTDFEVVEIPDQNG